MSSSKSVRCRNWTTVAYPESLPNDWLERFAEQGIPAFISPLHDKDKNPDGDSKKPHYHIVMMFSGNKTQEQVQQVSNECLSGVLVQRVKDIRGYARYLCHLDNPEKHRYEVSDVKSLGGADYLEVIGTLADTDEAVREMMEWCREQGIFSFARLADYSAKERPDWFRVLSSKRTVFISAYLKSLQWECDRENASR